MNSVPTHARAAPRSTTLCAPHLAARRLTWRDTIAVERFRIWQLLSLALRLLTHLPRFLRRPEATTTLLVHLRTRGDTVDGHEKQLLRLDLSKEMIDIRKDGGENLLLSEPEVGVLVIGM